MKTGIKSIYNILLFILSDSPSLLLDNSILLAVTGFFIGGVSNLISAAIAADLGMLVLYHSIPDV